MVRTMSLAASLYWLSFTGGANCFRFPISFKGTVFLPWEQDRHWDNFFFLRTRVGSGSLAWWFRLISLVIAVVLVPSPPRPSAHTHSSGILVPTLHGPSPHTHSSGVSSNSRLNFGTSSTFARRPGETVLTLSSSESIVPLYANVREETIGRSITRFSQDLFCLSN